MHLRPLDKAPSDWSGQFAQEVTSNSQKKFSFLCVLMVWPDLALSALRDDHLTYGQSVMTEGDKVQKDVGVQGAIEG
jgi:hypothetical protein